MWTQTPNWLILWALGHAILSATTGQLQRFKCINCLSRTHLYSSTHTLTPVKKSNSRCNLCNSMLAHAAFSTYPYVWQKGKKSNSMFFLFVFSRHFGSASLVTAPKSVLLFYVHCNKAKSSQFKTHWAARSRSRIPILWCFTKAVAPVCKIQLISAPRGHKQLISSTWVLCLMARKPCSSFRRRAAMKIYILKGFLTGCLHNLFSFTLWHTYAGNLERSRGL